MGNHLGFRVHVNPRVFLENGEWFKLSFFFNAYTKVCKSALQSPFLRFLHLKCHFEVRKLRNGIFWWKTGKFSNFIVPSWKNGGQIAKKGSVVHWSMVTRRICPNYSLLLHAVIEKNPGICRKTVIWETRHLNLETPNLHIMQIISCVNLILHTDF